MMQPSNTGVEEIDHDATFKYWSGGIWALGRPFMAYNFVCLILDNISSPYARHSLNIYPFLPLLSFLFPFSQKRKLFNAQDTLEEFSR
jgi:hypothetical protein